MLLGLLFALPATAQTAPTADPHEADHRALSSIRAAYEAAVRTGALAPLKPFLAPEASAITVTAESVRSFAELEAYWTRFQQIIGAGGVYEVKINPERTDFFGDTAVSRGTSAEQIRAATGGKFNFNSHWTVVCVKTNGAWKVLRVHAAMDPLTNVFVQKQMRSLKLICGFGGAVAALIILGFGRWIWRSIAKPESEGGLPRVQ